MAQRRPKDTTPSISWFNGRSVARKLSAELKEVQDELNIANDQVARLGELGRDLVSEIEKVRQERDSAHEQLQALGGLSILQLEARRKELETEISEHACKLSRERFEIAAAWQELKRQIYEAKKNIVITQEIELLQEAGVYDYRHPLTDAVAYQEALRDIQNEIKQMIKKDGGAVLCATDWTVNGSSAQGRAMVRDISKLMLRAFNAEADNLVRGLKPYKLDSSLNRLSKVADTIQRLGKTMNIQISPAYCQLRMRELELTSDFLQKREEEREVERKERERLREERLAQQELERERARLEKERQHYTNALDALLENGDNEGAARVRQQLVDVDHAIETVDYRAANIRAGYVYLISNIGAFGEKMVKIGMTRRLDPMERVRELGDASVPFRFDVHALFFSDDAVGIETALHERLSYARVNVVNRRREFFRVTPLEVKVHLSELAGELLQFEEIPEAIEYRQSLSVQKMQQA